jgi:hypothetical protein
MVDSPTSIVFPNNRNRVGSTGRGRCSGSRLIREWAWIRASIGKMTFLSTSIALPLNLHWVLGSSGPLNTLTSSSRCLEIVGVLNDLTLRSRESLSSWLQPRLKLQLSRMEHRSSGRWPNMLSRATSQLMLMH